MHCLLRLTRRCCSWTSTRVFLFRGGTPSVAASVREQSCLTSKEEERGRSLSERFVGRNFGTQENTNEQSQSEKLSLKENGSTKNEAS
jgi:hypothetical protein